MSKSTTIEKPTIKAVLVYAEALRSRAETRRVRDPWAKAYEPSEAVARKLCAQLGPDEALEVLAARAVACESEYREDCEAAKRSLERHQRRHEKASRDRTAERERQTLGRRLDQALAAFSVISSVNAATIGAGIKGSERSRPPADHGDVSGEAWYVARKAVREVERLLDRARVRDVEKAA